MADEKKEGSFTITDKRRFVVDELGEVKPEGEAGTEEKKKVSDSSFSDKEAPRGGKRAEFFHDEDVPFPEIDFSTFILSLSSSAILHLGLMENPYTKTVEQNLPLAKQTIDIISMLKDKTKGNLSEDEENLIAHLLTDLRFKYVNELNKK